MSETFLSVLKDFSALDLYGYREADRRRFDFAATVARDWARPLAGQTLWSHGEGVDKDVRMLLADEESEIKAYVARHNVRNQAKLTEAIEDFKKTPLAGSLFKLKTIWVPDGFDADDESARETMHAYLRSAVVDDILFNVVFGRITAQDMHIFLSASGTVGLQLALLAFVAENAMGNLARPSEALGVSPGPIRERLLIIQAAGFVGNPDGERGFGLINEITPRGRVFLDLLARLELESRQGSLSPELAYILEKLGCPADDTDSFEPDPEWPPTPGLQGLLVVMAGARSNFGVDLQSLSYRTFASWAQV